MDGTDNFDTRLIMNDLAQKHGIPWIYGACVGSYGITYTILPGETPCLNCLLGTIPLGGIPVIRPAFCRKLCRWLRRMERLRR